MFYRLNGVRALFLKIEIHQENIAVFRLFDGHWWTQSPEAMEVVAGENKKPLFPPVIGAIKSIKNQNWYLIKGLVLCHINGGLGVG